MRILAVLIVPPAIWFALVIIWLWLPQPQPFPPAFGDVRNKVGAALTGLAGMVYLAFVVWNVLSILGEGGRQLDSALQPAGLTGEPYLVVGRRYSGTVSGRQVSVEFVPAVALQRPMVNISAAVTAAHRLTAGWTEPLIGCRDCTRVQPTDSRMGGLVVRSDDESWATSFVNSQPAADLVWLLLSDPDGQGARFVHLEPGRVWLQARPTAAGLARVGEWVQALASLSAEAERSPDPR